MIRITEAEELALAVLFTPLILKAGDYFLEEGQLCRYVGFIEEGLVRYYINDNGIEKTLYFNKEGEFVSNYQSFLPREPSNTSIQAIEDTVLNGSGDLEHLLIHGLTAVVMMVNSFLLIYRLNRT